jgi:hypothetical protein
MGSAYPDYMPHIVGLAFAQHTALVSLGFADVREEPEPE